MALRQASRRGATVASRLNLAPASISHHHSPIPIAQLASPLSTFSPAAISAPLSQPTLPNPNLSPTTGAIAASPARGVFAAPWLAVSSRRFAAAAGSAESKVITVASPSEFKSLVNDASRLVVVDFTAAWCGPCRSIAPLLDEISQASDSVAIAKVDIDDEALAEVVNSARINSVPTFHFYKAGKLLSKFSGADALKLKDTIALLQK